ncbi:helix-turn-helix domain-containing protein [Kitasatospora sp. RB6PN24]|uniref:helix-turn-helix domain-containing protein n=1 Tax=Kitasatospora humi TaxID=2893891 RepID=UPI001E2F9229|nr:helix-turn-helix domain-containing protein [Kitasatospora humi]MCC9307211.1 helix-turn-helix domain-containing protein [Kitasatospora humi]
MSVGPRSMADEPLPGSARDGDRSDGARHGDRLDALLDQLRLQSDRPDGPARLVGWLARQLAADVTLTVRAPGTACPAPPTAAAPAPEASAPAGAAERLAPAAVAVGRLLNGEPPPPATPATTDRAPVQAGPLPDPLPGPLPDPTVRLFPIGVRRPHAVLALRRPEPLTALEVRLVTHTETVLGRLLAARESAAERAALHQVSASLRVAAFQLLMGGQITLARRTAAALVPGVLVHERARVYLVDCTTTDRNVTARVLAGSLAGRALLVRCPAHDTHLIVLAPLPQDAPLDEQGWCPTGLALRDVVERRPDHHLGGSTTVDLARTADAYREAFNALTVARNLPHRHALYQAQTQLAQLLGESATAWAERLLAPVLELPRDQRDEVIETTRLALAFSHAQTGRMLDVHRNTVARRIERGVGMLGLDWGSFQERAVLDLALQLLGEAPGRGSTGHRVRLSAILSCEAAKAWAQAFLAPLAEDRRPLLRTLAGWVTAGANARDTQAALGLHQQTVLDHLRTAERLLQRELTAGRGGAYELAWALWVSGAAALPGAPRRGSCAGGAAPG